MILGFLNSSEHKPYIPSTTFIQIWPPKVEGINILLLSKSFLLIPWKSCKVTAEEMYNLCACAQVLFSSTVCNSKTLETT